MPNERWRFFFSLSLRICSDEFLALALLARVSVYSFISGSNHFITQHSI